jgi:ornithine cyclodeaminase
MRIVSLDEIRAASDLGQIFEAVRSGFVALSEGQVTIAAVGYLPFPERGGDCHIKAAAMTGADVYAVKIASTFAANAAAGLRTSDGMMALFNSRTGEPLALLLDRGWLTDLRTGVAGAIATKAILPAGAQTVGIVGTGIQAKLNAQLVASHCGIARVLLWGRRHDDAERLAAELAGDIGEVRSVSSLEELASAADLVITTTPARSPLLTAAMFERPARIVAIGADAPGKQEIATDLSAGMDVLIADDSEQCLDHGELAHPYRAGLIAAQRVQELGAFLSDPVPVAPERSVLIDLTGVGVQDLQIAAAVWSRLARLEIGERRT